MPLHNHIVKEAWTRDRCEGKTKGTSPYDIFAETCMSTPDTTQVFGLWIVDSGHT
ncbi:hypothetical protein NQZ68_003476 [Dissostichus eleginoides]|nr:hypothetical protein NQZ68_003476 [Dissostichus eleginoides]